MAEIKAQSTISLASVKTVNDAAEYAKDRANYAAGKAEEAEGYANQARTEAGVAKAQAVTATNYANSALNQLGIVEDVVGVLTWASEHGSFTLTADTTVQNGKVYFTYDSTAQDYVPVVAPADDPHAAGYYELAVDEAMESFIMSHLAVTSRGLWVLPNGMGSASNAQYAPNYKVLLSNNGMYVYDGSGALVSTFGESITLSANRAQYIGNNNAYIVFDPTGNNGRGSITIGGSSIQMGSQTLEQVLAAKADSSSVYTKTEADNTFLTDVDVSVTQTATGADITVNGDTVSLSDGAKGDKGDKGDTGTSVSSSTPFYQLASSAPTKPADNVMTPTGWSTTEPEYDTEQDCYVTFRTVYDDGTCKWSDVSKSSSYAIGKDAYEAVDIAKDEVIGNLFEYAESADEVLSTKADADNVYTKNESDEYLDRKVGLVDGVVSTDFLENFNAVKDRINLTAEQILFSNEMVSTVIEQNSADIEALTNSVIIDTTEPSITLGNPLDFHIKITNQSGNQRISFFRDSMTETAYISGNKLYIAESEVTNTQRIGAFIWVKQSSNRISLRYSPQG